MKQFILSFTRGLTLSGLLLSQSWSANAATGEMGTGIPVFGLYTHPINGAGGYITVWSLKNPSIPFPQGCTALQIFPGTQGASSYKDILAILLTAVSLNKPVRFYSHFDRDGGCVVDYVQIVH